MIPRFLAERLACPRDGRPLKQRTESLACEAGHEYPVVDGIPIMLVAEERQTHPEADRALDAAVARSELKWDDGSSGPEVDPVVQAVIGATCGHLFSPHRGKLSQYPIPDLRLPSSTNGGAFLDIGCNWGRWSIAAARKGYRVVGLDPSFGSLVVARKVCRQLGADVTFVAGDARFPPFSRESFSTAFSYSVLQHFDKGDVRKALPAIARILTKDGLAMIQMPNAYGIRCVMHQVKRGFRTAGRFDVRYWTVPELKRAFERDIGPSTIVVDGFFGLGIQPANMDLYSPTHRAIVQLSELLRGVSGRIGALRYVADSLYVMSHPR